MIVSHNYLAIDLGAESGWTIVGTLDDDHLFRESTGQAPF